MEEAVAFFKGQAGTFSIMSGSPDDVAKIASTVDDMFRNSPQPTKTESEKAFGLTFVNMLGNVKAFILSICMAVVFTTLHAFQVFTNGANPQGSFSTQVQPHGPMYAQCPKR